VNATDQDAGENGTIARYVINGAEESRLFSIDNRGLIVAREALDREDADVRRFHVLAIDSGRPPRTGTALVVVNVEDVDDQSPIFTPEDYRLSVPENQPSGLPIGAVTAHDADLPPNNEFRYAFASDNSATDCFRVDPLNGTLTTRCSLDRELQPVYYLAVVAISTQQRSGGDVTGPSSSSSSRDLLKWPLSAGTGSSTSTATVIVYVTDQNDNPPTFFFPSTPNNDTVGVSSSAPPGYVVTKLLARDPDEDANAKLTYRLVEIREQQLLFPASFSSASASSFDHDGSGNVVRVVGQPLSQQQQQQQQSTWGNGSRTSGDAAAGDGAPWFRVDPVLGDVIVDRPLVGIDHRVFRLKVAVDDSAPFNSLSATAHLNVIVNRSIPYVPQYSIPKFGSAPSAPDAERSGSGHLQSAGTVYAVGFGTSLAVIVISVVIVVLFCARRRRTNGHLGRVSSCSCCCCCGGGSGCCRLKRRRHAQERRLVDKSGCGETGNGKDADGFDGGGRPIEGVKMLSPNTVSGVAVGTRESAGGVPVECTSIGRSSSAGFNVTATSESMQKDNNENNNKGNNSSSSNVNNGQVKYHKFSI
jgi:hypothetical protein